MQKPIADFAEVLIPNIISGAEVVNSVAQGGAHSMAAGLKHTLPEMGLISYGVYEANKAIKGIRNSKLLKRKAAQEAAEQGQLAIEKLKQLEAMELRKAQQKGDLGRNIAGGALLTGGVALTGAGLLGAKQFVDGMESYEDS